MIEYDVSERRKVKKAFMDSLVANGQSSWR